MVNDEISYENGYLESVLVDGNEMEISEIQEESIENWFQKKCGRSNWKGLIEQNCEFVGNEDPELVFYFLERMRIRRYLIVCWTRRGFQRQRLYFSLMRQRK